VLANVGQEMMRNGRQHPLPWETLRDFIDRTICGFVSAETRRRADADRVFGDGVRQEMMRNGRQHPLPWETLRDFIDRTIVSAETRRRADADRVFVYGGAFLEVSRPLSPCVVRSTRVIGPVFEVELEVPK
jgi:hypothetical protein